MKASVTALLVFSISPAIAAEKLITPSFEISIDVRCPEGAVSCDQVRYTGISKKTGKAIALTGSTLHTTCADGVTPCRFLGYRFKNGKVTYTVFESGELVVTQGDKLLLQESGSWQ
jgi:hypothetical protein